MAQSYCVTPYSFDQGSLLVSPRKSTLDLHPNICNLKHKRGHTNISLASTHEKHHEVLTMLTEGLIDMPLHRFIQSPPMVQYIVGSTFPCYQISLHPSIGDTSKNTLSLPQISKVVDDSLYTSYVDLQKLAISS